MSAHGWLRQRFADSPAPLREKLEAAVVALDPDADLADALLAAACRTLDDVRGRLDRRDAAFDLLLADGLLTLACEAVAYSDPRRLAERCQKMGPGGALGGVAGRWEGGADGKAKG